MSLPPAIPPVGAVDLLGKASAGGSMPGGAGPAPQAPQELVDRFQQLYDAPASVAHTDTGNVVSNLLTKHQEAVHHEQQELERMQADLPHMSPVELQMRTIELTHDAAINSFRMNVGVSFASSINKSLKSLLTNGQQ